MMSRAACIATAKRIRVPRTICVSPIVFFFHLLSFDSANNAPTATSVAACVDWHEVDRVSPALLVLKGRFEVGPSSTHGSGNPLMQSEQCPQHKNGKEKQHRTSLLRARLRGGGSETRFLSNKERWEACGYSLQPDLSPEAHPDVPLDTKLGDAAEFNDANAVRRLIQAGANVNCADWQGYTPLHRAAWQGSLEALEVLLQAGANANVQDQVGGRTPLHQAAAQGHKRVVERLVACGADPHLRDFPYKPDVNQIAGYWEAIREVGPVVTAEAGQCADGTLEYRGLTPKEYAEDEEQYSTAELLRPWTDEY